MRLRLDKQLCFAFYSATHAVTRAYRSQLGELGVTYPQYLLLLALWGDPDGSTRGRTVKALAQPTLRRVADGKRGKFGRICARAQSTDL